MRSSRLLEMMLLLQARGTVTAAELAGRLEVSPRTIYRDAEALSAAGVPVYAERGRGGGISLLPGYRADLTGLTRDEARALFIRAATCDVQEDLGLSGEVLRSALAKMLRAVPSPFRESASASCPHHHSHSSLSTPTAGTSRSTALTSQGLRNLALGFGTVRAGCGPSQGSPGGAIVVREKTRMDGLPVQECLAARRGCWRT